MTASPPATVGVRSAPAADLTLRPVVTVTPGQTLAARIISAEGGRVELALAGARVVAESQLPLEPGETVRLTVAQADDERIVMRLTPETAGGSGRAAASPAAPGLPAAAARVLAQAVQPGGMSREAWQALTARAVAAGVQTPMQAVAFVRLEAAGLPVTAATVAGLADLADGAPLGRLLGLVASTPGSTTVAGAALSPAGGGAQTATPVAAGAPAPAGAGGVVTTGTTPAPAAAGTAAPAPAPAATAPTAAPANAATSPAASTPAPTGSSVPQQAAPAAMSAPAQPGAVTAQHPLARLAVLVQTITADATSGDPHRVRRAIAALGHGADPQTRGPHGAAETTLRALLQEAAAAPDTPAQTARVAERVADGIVAQALAPAALAASADPTQVGAYAQVPLPGGQTAEVRVLPDPEGERDAAGEGGTTRVAFLLHLSALGPVVVEAVVSPGGIDATVRSQAASARAFLAEQTAELAEGLARVRPDGRPPRVSVERLHGPPPRILPAPSSPGLDLAV